MSLTKTTKKSVQDKVVDELPTYSLANKKRHRSFVLYGRSGTGKTTLASTFPKPMIYFDVKDRGDDSITDIDGIDGYEVNSTEDLEMAYWYLKQNPKKYRSCCIDTVSQLQQIVVQEQAARAKRKTAKIAGDWGSLTKRDWGDIAAYMKEWILNYRDLPMTVIFIAQDRNFNFDEEEEGDNVLTPEVGPALSPSIVKVLNASVSMIGNTFIRAREIVKEVKGKKKDVMKTEFCLRVGPNPVYTTKIRKPRSIQAPELIVDPSYADIMEIIEGE